MTYPTTPGGRAILARAATAQNAARLRRDQAQRFAGELGINGDDLYQAAMAVWSNLNPQTVTFERALSVAGAALAAVARSALTDTTDKIEEDALAALGKLSKGGPWQPGERKH